MSKKTEDLKTEDIQEEVVTTDPGEETVDFVLPVVGMDAQALRPLFVCVNGESVALRPGEPVKLKRKFIEAIKNANDQRMAAIRYMLEQQELGRKALENL